MVETAGIEALRPGEVQCWFFAVDRFRAGDLAALLSADERERAGRFVFERDRAGFVVCRGLLRRLLAPHAGQPPASLRFVGGPAGKPALAAGAGSQVTFNLSHSHGHGLVAISRERPLGVDLEAIRPIPEMDALVASHFAPEERDEFARLGEDARLRAFHAGWTRKEAVLKATGEGLGRDLASFAVRIAPEPGAARLLRLDGEPEAASHWSIVDLDLGPGFAAALATRGPRPAVHLRRLDPERPDAAGAP